MMWSCEKDEPTTNADFLGTYAGTIISSSKYTPTKSNQGVAFEESGSTIKSVNISKDSTNIYLDGVKMEGGPEIFTLKKDGSHILSISSKTIEYSFSTNGKVFKSQMNNSILYEFLVTSSGAGILRKS